MKGAVYKTSLNRIKRRITKSFLDIAILAVLEENKDLNGYEILNRIYKKLGVLLSSGTVYSTLYTLEREQLVKSVLHLNCRTYALTSKGHDKLEQVDDLISVFNLFINRLCSKNMPVKSNALNLPSSIES